MRGYHYSQIGRKPEKDLRNYGGLLSTREEELVEVK
jgi:hypothetical protein